MSGGISRGVCRDEEENERQYRVVDQLLTMHAVLRDRYMRWALVLNTGQIAVSLVLCGFAFVGDDVLRAVGLEPPLARVVFGFAAVVVLILSITEFRVDWRAAGSRHDRAVRELGALKGKYRSWWDEGKGQFVAITDEFETVQGMLPPIPERLFVRLKARHQFKRLLSREVSDNPMAPAFVLGLRLRLEGMWLACRRRRRKGEEKTGRVEC